MYLKSSTSTGYKNHLLLNWAFSFITWSHLSSVIRRTDKETILLQCSPQFLPEKKQKCRSVADSFALHLERGEAVTMIEAGGRFC